MERLEGRLEEEPVAAPSLGQEEWMQSRGHGEDQVEVLRGEQTTRLRLRPRGLLQALAFGAVSVSAGVVEGDLAAAVVAHLEMAAQKGRPARHDVSDHPAAVAAPVVATAERVPGKSPPTPAVGPPGPPKRYLRADRPQDAPRRPRSPASTPRAGSGDGA